MGRPIGSKNKPKIIEQNPRPALKINPMTLAHSRIRKQIANDALEMPRIEPYQPPPGVIPESQKTSTLAMDSTPYDVVNQVYVGSNFFKGYPYLALQSQRPEYRKITETIAQELTRKWVKIVARGDADKADKVAALEKLMEQFKVRDVFRKAAELDGFYGRGQVYIDVNKPSGGRASDDEKELDTPLVISPAKIRKGSLNGFKAIEPVWTYPSYYNADKPLEPDYYEPRSWYVLGKSVHKSRLLKFVSREMPDLLKAAYNFSGLSMSQMAEPYVENFLRTRDSVSDMVHSFSVMGVKTNMQDILSGVSSANDTSIFDRADLFNNLRDNRGLFLLDKDSEEFFLFNVPLNGLDALQAQSQEQIASVASIPLVKLLGIQPAGLNASADGEIRVFYDHIHAWQEILFGTNLQIVLQILQLHAFGEIDKDIAYEFQPLYELSELDRSTVRKNDADTDAVLISVGAISPDDSRQRVASDPESLYHGLDVDDGEDLDDREDDLQANAMLRDK